LICSHIIFLKKKPQIFLKNWNSLDERFRVDMIPEQEISEEDMMEKITVKTSRQIEMIDITPEVNRRIKKSGAQEGICLIYCPHTTAGLTINENADPNVVKDILSGLNRLIPEDRPYLHAEGNSPAHIKSSLLGCSKMIIIEGRKLALGTWQSVFFCEFDGPRTRSVWVKIIEG
jgi:secondary thiamine-phosphate synthase enzyme